MPAIISIPSGGPRQSSITSAPYTETGRSPTRLSAEASITVARLMARKRLLPLPAWIPSVASCGASYSHCARGRFCSDLCCLFSGEVSQPARTWRHQRARGTSCNWCYVLVRDAKSRPGRGACESAAGYRICPVSKSISKTSWRATSSAVTQSFFSPAPGSDLARCWPSRTARRSRSRLR